MNEQTVVTLALLGLIAVLVVAAFLILGPQLGNLLSMPTGVLQ